MNIRDLKAHLKFLKDDKKRTLKALNKVYYSDKKLRNEYFIELDEIKEEIKKVTFKIKMMEEMKNVKTNNTSNS